MSPIELGREGRGKRSEGESLNVAQCVSLTLYVDVYKVVRSGVRSRNILHYILFIL